MACLLYHRSGSWHSGSVTKFFLTFVLTVCLSGCGVGYMMSSSWYQMKLLLSRVDLDEARGSGRLSAEQLETLQLIDDVKSFGVDLGLAGSDN